MPASDMSSELSLESVLSGSGESLEQLLRCALPGHADAGAELAALFWSAWRRQSQLHPQLLDAVEPLREALARLQPEQWLAAAEHPLWTLLELLQRSGAGYQPELGRTGEKLLADWGPVLRAATADDWPAAAAAATAQWLQEQSRLGRLEQRLADSERGQLRSRRAQQQAARALNRALAGKQLTQSLAEYLQGDWYRELQWALLQFGEESEQWRRRVDLTSQLVASVQDPGGDNERRQQIYALIAEVGPELRAVLGEHAPDPQALERQLALIEEHHLRLLRGQSLTIAPFALIANDDPWLSSSTSISRDLLQQVTELELGRWFLLRGADGELRIKLVLKMKSTGQLLFVNRMGVKALQKSFEEFAYLLSLGSAVALPPVEHSRPLLLQLLQQLLQRGAQQERVRAEERLREEMESQRRHEAQAKAIAEAKALAAAQEQAQAAAEAETQQRARDTEQRRRQAVLDASGDNSGQRLRSERQQATLLPIGSWVEFHDELGVAQRLKLAVKLPSTGKMIFVDRDGVRRAEFERDGLAARLLEGSALIIDQGRQFEDTLARVVDSLRRDRANRE